MLWVLAFMVTIASGDDPLSPLNALPICRRAILPFFVVPTYNMTALEEESTFAVMNLQLHKIKITTSLKQWQQCLTISDEYLQQSVTINNPNRTTGVGLLLSAHSLSRLKSAYLPLKLKVISFTRIDIFAGFFFNQLRNISKEQWDTQLMSASTHCILIAV